MKNFLFIDTNIFVQLCAQEKEGDKLIDLEEIKKLIENKQIFLLMPEIVELELKAQIEDKFDRIKKQIGEIKEFTRNGRLNSKIKEDVILKIDEVITERIENSDLVQKNINVILESSQTIKIKINPDHLSNSYKKFVSNTKPFKKDQKGEIQTDCLIIEALKEYLSNEVDYKLYFCCQNNSDFCITKDNKKIHSDIQKEFTSEIIYYENLFQMINEKFNGKFSTEQISTLSQMLNNVNIADDVIKSIEIVGLVNKASQKMADNLQLYIEPAQKLLIENLNNQLQKTSKSQLEQIAKYAKLNAGTFNAYLEVLKDTVEKMNESSVFQYVNRLNLNNNEDDKSK